MRQYRMERENERRETEEIEIFDVAQRYTVYMVSITREGRIQKENK